MNIKNHFKRLTIIIVLLLLFGFSFPKPVHAGLIEDITAAPAKIFWLMEEGILWWLNDTFTNKDHHAEMTKSIDSDGNISTSFVTYLSPETIIKGKFIIFDANIFRNIENITDPEQFYDYDSEKDDTTGEYKNAVVGGKIKLRKTISGWYYTIRNFSIVALLSVLVYVGIRMVLSSLAQDKAKYKTMFKDWLVAICLVVVMHYFMIAILNISTMITDALGGGQNSDMSGQLAADITAILQGENYSAKNEAGEDMDLGDAYAKIFVLGGVIVYTVIFAVKYLKREFTILFLAIIGPAACITYPIDKIGDGKAQAYNRWFTEFLYQVIIQPFHLLLYIVLIGTAAELADANILYAIVCFAVMVPAEKFIREMFGFKDKLGSPLGNLMKAGMARDLVNRATSALMKGKSGGSGGKGGQEGANDSLPPSPHTRNIDDSLLVGGTNNGGEGGNNNGVSPAEAGNGSNGLPAGGNTQENNNPQQAMLDAYDENYGTDEWDAQERDAMARANNNSEGMPYSNEEYEQILRDSGYSDEEIQEMMRESNPQQDMLDAYDENYGTDDWNAQERDAMARSNNDSDGMQYSNEEYEQILRDSGYSDDEIRDMMQENAPEMAGDAAGIAALNESEENSRTINGETEGDRSEESQEAQRQINNAVEQQAQSLRENIRRVNAQRMAKKYGTTRKSRRNLKRAGKIAKGVLKGTGKLAKLAAIAGAATIGTGIALATGNGAEAFAIATGAAGIIASDVGRSAKRTIKGFGTYAKSAAKDYYRNDAIPFVSRISNSGLGQALGIDREGRAFSQFESNPEQQNRAILSYRKNNNGDNPDYNQLRNEMRDRYALSQYGLNNDQIDNAISSYQSLRDAQQAALLERGDVTQEELDNASEKALMETAFASSLADRYSQKDFGSEKTMNEAVKTIADRFEKQGVSRSIAEGSAKRYLQQAAKIKKTDMVKLPTNDATVDVNTQPVVPNLAGTLNINTETLTERNVEQLTRVNVRVHELGLDEGQLRMLAGNTIRGTNTESTITNFEQKIEVASDYINNPSIRNDVENYLRKNGTEVTREKVDEEMRERLVLSDTFNIKGKKDMNAMRDLEKTKFKTKSQKQLARETAVKTKGMSETQKATLEKGIVKDLREGGSSAQQAKQDAKNIMDLAEMYNANQTPQ